MCLGIPMQVLSIEGNAATCRGRNGLETIDVVLVAPVVPGEWLLTWLGAARARLGADEAGRIDRALDALAAIERGEPVDVSDYFADLVARGPELPDHLRSGS